MVQDQKYKPMPTIWQVPDDLWTRIEPKIRSAKPGMDWGRPIANLRSIFNGVLYVLRTGCQWAAVPEVFGKKSTLHDWFQRWARAGTFSLIWADLIEFADQLGMVDWHWQSADGGMGKAPLGGDATGRNPTDRGKLGTKRSLIVDGNGGPLGVIITAANINDHLVLGETIEAIVVERPDPEEVKQNLCLDKGYDNKTGHKVCEEQGYEAHIRRIGEVDTGERPEGYKPRRWVVERALGWLNRCRKILVRFEKKAENHESLVALACALLWYRRLKRVGATI